MILAYILGLLIPLLILRPILQLGAKRLLGGNPFTHKIPRIHHSHYGLLILAITVTLSIILGQNIILNFFQGFGLGLLLDEANASLYLQQQEPDITRLYVKSLWPTIIIFTVLILSTYILNQIITWAQ